MKELKIILIKRNKLIILLLLVLLIISQFSVHVFAYKKSFPPKEAIESITVRELKMHMDFLASDELGGRLTFNRMHTKNLSSKRHFGIVCPNRDQ